MATKSKLPPQPASTVDESGRRIYAGSLSATTTELSEVQQDTILEAIKKGPEMPSALVGKLGLNLFNPHSGESVRRFIAQLEKDGHAKQVRDERGKLLGWSSTEPEEKKL